MNLGTLALAVRLARRELRTGIRGFGVFLGCLSLGVFAVTAVGSFSEAARSGLLADARALLGGDLEIRLPHRELTEEQRAHLEARGRLSAIAEMRVMAGPPGGRELVELKAVDRGYPLYGDVILEPPGPLANALGERNGRFGAAVDESLLHRLGLGLNDPVTVGSETYRIRAVIAAEPDRAVRAFSLGPRLMVARESLARTGLLAPGSLVFHAYRLRLPPEADPRAVRRELEERFPQAGWRIRGFEEAAPRVRRFLDQMTTNLTLVGLCALLVGGLGVAGGVRGYLEKKTLHIAAMKCVGATGDLLFATYLLQVLALAVVGTGAGLAAGAAVPYLAGGLVGSWLPVPLRPSLFPGILAAGAAYGVLIAVAFSLRSLGAARQVSPSVLFRGYAGRRRAPPGAAGHRGDRRVGSRAGGAGGDHRR